MRSLRATFRGMKSSATPLSARAFFERRLHGFNKTDAHKATGLAYTAVHDASCDGPTRKVETLEKLMRWSFRALEEHGCYLSVAKTLGLNEEEELRTALARLARRRPRRSPQKRGGAGRKAAASP